MNLFVTRVFDPRGNAAALQEVTASLGRHFTLAVEMARRELKDRYAGSALGLAWAFLMPLLVMGTYILVFGTVFRVRLGPGDGGFSFTAFALSGLAPWIALQETVSRAPVAVVASGNLVKQIVFPSEILPLKIVLASFPTLGIGVGLALLVSIASAHATLLGLCVLLPLAFVIFVCIVGGIAYVLAAIGVFMRDVKDIVSVLLTVGLFSHPILYPPGNVPNWLEWVFLPSPISHLIWCFQDAIFYGAAVHPWSWLVASIVSFLFVALGWRVFRMLKPTFGNAL